jgi:hypothetical protein
MGFKFGRIMGMNESTFMFDAMLPKELNCYT